MAAINFGGYGNTGFRNPGTVGAPILQQPPTGSMPQQRQMYSSGYDTGAASRRQQEQERERMEQERMTTQNALLQQQLQDAQAASKRQEQEYFDRNWNAGNNQSPVAQRAMAELAQMQYGATPKQQIGTSAPVSQAAYEQYILQQELAKQEQQRRMQGQSRSTTTTNRPSFDLNAIQALIQLLPGRI